MVRCLLQQLLSLCRCRVRVDEALRNRRFLYQLMLNGEKCVEEGEEGCDVK